MNKSLLPVAAASLMAIATSCGQQEEMIEKPDFASATGIFDIDALEALGRVSNPQVSPDGKKVLYGVSYESVELNKSNNELYTMNLDGSDVKRLTKTAMSEAEAVWIDNGRKIAFVAAHDGKPQLWVMNADGTNRHVVSRLENGVGGFKVSPDGKKVVIVSTVKYNRTAQDVYPDLTKATGRLIDDMMYKHWDEWVTEIPHPFIADFDGKSISNERDIMADEPLYEAPTKPFGGAESFAWSPDSRQLVYVSRKKTGKEYALSTNSDLYLFDVEAGTTTCLTEGMMGYDTLPVFSPDGSKLAWLSMEHDGYESDKNRIFTLDRATGTKTDLTAEWDYTVDDIAFSPDGATIYFRAYKDGVMPVFAIPAAGGEVTEVAGGECDWASLSPAADGRIIAMRHSMLYPNEVFSIDTTNGEVKQLSDVNGSILAQLDMPTVERRMVPTTDGKEMLVWVIKPQGFDAEKKYPGIFYCQGGPQQAVSQFWSFRWNLALMSANGYVVIAPNRRGLPGFGTEWNAQISGDYGGQNMRDYLAAVDHVKTEPWIDETRIGCTGASYGGFSTYWLAGNHEGRFAAFIAHAGIFNMEAQYLETEEMWFANWDMGGGAANAPADSADDPDYGAYWNTKNPTAQATFATSPHRFAANWDKPILITHGELDYRILSSQGEMAFNAAKLRGIPAEMVIFPDENHWILKPQNAILWQRLFFRWFDKWLKDQ